MSLLLLVAFFVMVTWAFAWVLCRSAARGDRAGERARMDTTRRREQRDEDDTVVRLYPRLARDVTRVPPDSDDAA